MRRDEVKSPDIFVVVRRLERTKPFLMRRTSIEQQHGGRVEDGTRRRSSTAGWVSQNKEKAKTWKRDWRLRRAMPAGDKKQAQKLYTRRQWYQVAAAAIAQETRNRIRKMLFCHMLSHLISFVKSVSSVVIALSFISFFLPALPLSCWR